MSVNLSGPGAAAKLAGKLEGASLLAAGAGELELVRRHVFDALGALRAGFAVSEVGRVLSAPGWGEAGPVGNVRRLCAAVRASEIDDIHAPSSTTAGSVAVPVALAVAAAVGADDRRVLDGVLCGYEAMIRFGEAIDGARVIYRGIWGSYATAPIGAAAAAATVLGLDAGQVADALAIAATRLSGAQNLTEGVTPRWLAFGSAAADGVLAALCAACGVAGRADAFEAVVPGALRLDFDQELFAERLAGPWALSEVDVKPFCTARQALSAVEAVRLAVAEVGLGSVARIAVKVPAQVRAMVDRPDPAGRQTMGSVQFQAALALTQPARLYDVVRSGASADGAMRSIMDKIEVHEDAALTDWYPRRWGGTATVTPVSGAPVTVEVLDPAGSAARGFGWPDLVAKQVSMEQVSREAGSEAGSDSGAGSDSEAGSDRLQGLARACRQLGAGAPAGGSAAQLLVLAEQGRAARAYRAD